MTTTNEQLPPLPALPVDNPGAQERITDPNLSLSVPSSPPKAVQTAFAEYRRLVGEYRQVKADHAEARSAVESEARSAEEKIAEAAIAGKSVDAVKSGEGEARASAAAARTKQLGLKKAVDHAARLLESAVDEHREKWIAENSKRAAAQRERYESALDELRDVLGDLAEVWAIDDFLQGRGRYGRLEGAERISYRGAPVGGRVTIRPGEAPVPMDQVLAGLGQVFRLGEAARS